MLLSSPNLCFFIRTRHYCKDPGIGNSNLHFKRSCYKSKATEHLCLLASLDGSKPGYYSVPLVAETSVENFKGTDTIKHGLLHTSQIAPLVSLLLKGCGCPNLV